VKTTVKMILVAVTIFWVSMMNKLWLLILVSNIPVFSPINYQNEIHSLLFFSIISNEKIMVHLIGQKIPYFYYWLLVSA